MLWCYHHWWESAYHTFSLRVQRSLYPSENPQAVGSGSWWWNKSPGGSLDRQFWEVFFQHFKDVIQLFSSFHCSQMRCQEISYPYYLHKVSLFLCLLSNFFFMSLVFSHLNMMGQSEVFQLFFILVLFRVFRTSWIYKSMFSFKFGKFLVIIYLTIFSALVSFSSLLRIPKTHTLNCLIFFHRSWGAVHFLQSTICSLDEIISVDLSLSLWTPLPHSM